MNFTSLAFLVYFPVVLGLYWLLPERYRWALLLFASWLFYSAWNPPLLLLLLGTTALTYTAGRGIGGAGSAGVRRTWAVLGVGGPLLALIVFKYLDFLLGIGAGLLGLQRLPVPGLVLPVGISFYTFQTLSYVLDVYRGRIAPERHFGYYALFVSFFPQLVAGPIERPEHLLPQLRHPRPRNRGDMTGGIRLMLTGFFQKVAAADTLALLADPVFAHPGEATGPKVVLGTICFALQIYCDFSGYSLIARGAACMMGIDLTENFRRPYAAETIRDFWRRWHISLTGWFTDYLYKPLGGSRTGLARTLRNVMIVFLASGLWHGADWTFVVWGGIHGLYLCAGLLWRRRRGETPMLPRALGQVRTFALTCFAWLFFRANSMGDAILLLRRLSVGWGTPLTGVKAQTAVLAALALICVHHLEGKRRRNLYRTCLLAFLLVLSIGTLWLLHLSGGGESAFLYFQF